VLDSDDAKYGGFGNVAHKRYPTRNVEGTNRICITVPPRTAVVLREKKIEPKNAGE